MSKRLGKAKQRQLSDRDMLQEHRFCCYCGALSKEPDHVPARCFFPRNIAPEEYVFPSCVACNRFTRLDEQIVGVLLTSTFKEPEGADQERVAKLTTGILNNSQAVAKEWRSNGARLKRMFREAFGADGDVLRHAGYGLIELSGNTQAALDRFVLKLGHALYYKHVGRRLTGVVAYITTKNVRENAETIQNLLALAPEAPTIQRAGRSLTDRFDYRFNCGADLGVIWIVVHFGGQFIASFLAADHAFVTQADDDSQGKFLHSDRFRKLPSTMFLEAAVLENTLAAGTSVDVIPENGGGAGVRLWEPEP